MNIAPRCHALYAWPCCRPIIFYGWHMYSFWNVAIIGSNPEMHVRSLSPFKLTSKVVQRRWSRWMNIGIFIQWLQLFCISFMYKFYFSFHPTSYTALPFLSSTSTPFVSVNQWNRTSFLICSGAQLTWYPSVFPEINPSMICPSSKRYRQNDTETLVKPTCTAYPGTSVTLTAAGLPKDTWKSPQRI